MLDKLPLEILEQIVDELLLDFNTPLFVPSWFRNSNFSRCKFRDDLRNKNAFKDSIRSLAACSMKLGKLIRSIVRRFYDATSSVNSDLRVAVEYIMEINDYHVTNW